MAFVRKRSGTFKWPVTVEFPVDGGKFEKELFDAIFKRIGRSDFQDLADKGDVDLIEAVLVGWEGMQDEEGDDIPFSHSALKEQLDDPCWTKGVIAAYLKSLEGGATKN